MKISFNLIKFYLVIVFIFVGTTAICAQNTAVSQSSPRQEKLLNGLKILMWSDRSANNVELKVRVHSGSAFDPQGKEGVMKMLAENLFPTDASREYFTDDLGGNLQIAVNHDYTQITATAKPENLLPLIETVSRAFSLITVDKETTVKLKTAQLAKIAELEKNPEYITDQTVAKRLFGSFPYGRTVDGTAESINKIDYADLIFAKQRFLTADNATLAISGNFAPDLAFRAMRRGFGGWEKSDKRIPANFRQPDEPDSKPLTVAAANNQALKISYATRGLARNAKEFAASEILLQTLRDRLGNSQNSVQISDNWHFLPGSLVISRSILSSTDTEKGFPSDNYIQTITAKMISQPEFEQAKSKALATLAIKNAADWWLDADTYNLGSVAKDQMNFQNATLADVESLRNKLNKQSVATVVIVSGK